MKGIIAEIDSGKMIVIAKNGDFIKCKKLPNCNVGDEVNISKTSMTSIYKKMSAVAASFLIFAMLSTGVYAYYTPYSYVSVDINPSLELSMNRFEKVIGVHAFNEDAEKVLKASSKIKNKEIDDALEQILNTASAQGYLKKETSNSLMLVVSSDNEKEKELITSKVSQASTEVLSKLSSNYEVILEKAELDAYKAAKKQNISPGKVILASKFKQVKPDIDEEKIKNMPLQQAIQQIEKKEEKSDKTDKPVASANKDDNKPEDKYKNKIKNVKELIIEKNEDLGKKLQEQNNNKGKDKKENQSSNNQNQENKEKDTNKNDKTEAEDDKAKTDDSKSKEENKQQSEKDTTKKNN